MVFVVVLTISHKQTEKINKECNNLKALLKAWEV